jgi:phosphonate transport system ATP-binding protein
MVSNPNPALPALELRSAGLQRSGANGKGFALADIDLSITRGEQVALVGPSGAGKTTLLALLALQLRPDSGQLQVLGEPAWTLAEVNRHALRKRLFLAPQVPPLPPRQRVVTAVLAGLLPHMSLWQALSSLLYPRRAGEAAAQLAQLGLEHKLWERVDALSGGERQRVSLARMLASKAELLLADEPLSALDPDTGRRTIAVLASEARSRGATLVCSLHQVELAFAHFARVVGVRDGRIVFDLPSARVTDSQVRDLYAGEASEAPSGVVALNANAPAQGAPAERCF